VALFKILLIKYYKSKIKELQKYVDKTSLIFKSKTQKTAIKKFKKLKDKIKELSK
jgi:hypothetical protein